ncbi:MAG: hypothetical protein AAF539_06010 [Planctomycetota bacterium]
MPKAEDPNPRRLPRKKTRPTGTPFPVSALLNLMAGANIAAEDVPSFRDDRGQTHIGEVGQWSYCYREAATETGWLSAVEIRTLSGSTTSDSGE